MAEESSDEDYLIEEDDDDEGNILSKQELRNQKDEPAVYGEDDQI